MKLTLRLFFIILGIGLGVWLWMYLNPSPQVAVRRQLKKLGEAISFEGREGTATAALAAQKIGSFFAPEIMMNIEPRGVFPEQVERTEIVRQALYMRTQSDVRSFKLQLLDPVITIGVDKQSAIVELTVHAETAGDRHLIVQEMRFTMRLVDGDWLIYRVDTVRTLNQLQRPPQLELVAAA